MKIARKLRKSKLLMFERFFFPQVFLEFQIMVFLSFPSRTGKFFHFRTERAL